MPETAGRGGACGAGKLDFGGADWFGGGMKERLLYADSENNGDQLYFSGVQVPDPFVSFELSGRRIGIVNRLEYARVRKTSSLDEVWSMEGLMKRAKEAGGGAVGYPEDVLQLVAEENGLSGFRVAPDFPSGLAFALRERGLEVEVAEGLLLPERERKTDAEAKAIAKGNAAAAAGFRVVEKLLRESRIEGNRLKHNGRTLTAETVQRAIAVACLEKGAVATAPIVACGDQACDPHNRGSGPLRPHELIIVDIFPRVMKTGYHGDMTRTYLKGKPSEARKRLYETVFAAEQMALGEHRSGKSGPAIYRKVVEHFEAAGFATGYDNGTPVGFIHGLGHGLGLDVHEAPRVSPSGGKLKKGQVITVEPGLYYPGVGGVRVEDVIRVRNGEPELLSRHGYKWRIR